MAAEPAYQRPVPVSSIPAASAPGTSWASLAARFILSLLGAAGLIVGALMNWLRTPSSRVGTKIDIRFLWTTTAGDTDAFVRTVGFVAIVLGLLAILGLALRSGWLTRIAGALGIVEFVLFAITVSRAPSLTFPSAIAVGAWLALIGGVVALAGGFLGTRTVVTTTGPMATGTTTVVED